jgi:hypothetical protein
MERCSSLLGRFMGTAGDAGLERGDEGPLGVERRGERGGGEAWRVRAEGGCVAANTGLRTPLGESDPLLHTTSTHHRDKKGRQHRLGGRGL